MKKERASIKFPMWRKKVDPSMWTEDGTTIPNHFVNLWGINLDFINSISVKDPTSEVKIIIQRTNGGFDSNIEFSGNLTCAKEGLNKPVGDSAHRKNPAYRLYWPSDLTEMLKKQYSMSFIRDIENKITLNKTKLKTGEDIRNRDIENEIPFWEFLDIEYDKNTKMFFFTCYYKQKPLFPNFFNMLASSPTIKKVDNQLSKNKDSDLSFYQQNWRPIDNWITEINTNNVIYMLYSKSKSSIYIGKANNLYERFKNHHMGLKNYDYYRYELIPTELPQKVIGEIERMIIRIFQTTFKNDKGIETISISNIRIDNQTKDTNR
tara:strand:+ start:441 stop:1400 length:960 start_codon:yes stop_codon:yes gene_type:complete